MPKERLDPSHPRWDVIDSLRADGYKIPLKFYRAERIDTIDRIAAEVRSSSKPFEKKTARKKAKYQIRGVGEKTRVPDSDASKIRSNSRKAQTPVMGKPRGLSSEAIWMELRPEEYSFLEWWRLYPGPKRRVWVSVVRAALDMSLDQLQEKVGYTIPPLKGGDNGEEDA